MHRFFINPDHINDLQVTFPPDIAHQITHVLRLGEGDQVGVLDDSGTIHYVRLQKDPPESILTGTVYDQQAVTTEPHARLRLYFGLSNREKVEWVLQKGTEIGVAFFCPFVSSRTLMTSPALSPKKAARWARIIREAAEQSGRGRLPKLNPPQPLTDCFLEVQGSSCPSLIAWEDAPRDGNSLAEALSGFASGEVNLFVGPEGGFSAEEVSTALEAGIQVVSLGSRILRMETAAIVLPTLVLYQLDAL
jgi:16S rRNA (uracil1498-N3)-methyltransferase